MHNYTTVCVAFVLLVTAATVRSKVVMEVAMLFNQQPSQTTTSYLRPCTDVCVLCDHLETRCSSLNATSVEMIASAPDSTVVIVFTGNRLDALSHTLFDKIKPNLRLLDLSSNQLFKIANADVFAHLPNLVELVLDNNRLVFNTSEELASLRLLDKSLRILKLNAAFGGKDITLDNDEANDYVDLQLHTLLDQSNLRALERIELDDNALGTFNVITFTDYDDVHSGETSTGDEVFGLYKDIFCLTPALRHLSLRRNAIDTVDFDVQCIKSAARQQLDAVGVFQRLDLQSNMLSSLDASFVATLQTLALYNPHFRLYLADNPLKCDCALYSFFKFARSPLGRTVLADIDQLYCQDEDSLHFTIGKRLLDADLRLFCDSYTASVDGATSSTPVTQNYFVMPTRNRSMRVTHAPSSSSSSSSSAVNHHSKLKLFTFIACTVLISITILLIMRLHCRRYWRYKTSMFYRTIDPTADIAGRRSSEHRPMTSSHLSINLVENPTASSTINGYKFENVQLRHQDESELRETSVTNVTGRFGNSIRSFLFGASSSSSKSIVQIKRVASPPPSANTRIKSGREKKKKAVSLTSAVLKKQDKKANAAATTSPPTALVRFISVDDSDNEDDDDEKRKCDVKVEREMQTVVSAASFLDANDDDTTHMIGANDVYQTTTRTKKLFVAPERYFM